nr:glycosyltransferase [Dissulfurirhabdus thermomarina]
MDPAVFSHVVCYLSGPVPADEELRRSGFDVRVMPYGARQLRRFRPGLVRRLRRLARETGAHVVHAHRYRPTLYALLAARGLPGLRVVASVHGLNRFRSASRRLADRLLWPGLDRVVAVSEGVRRDVLAAHPWFPEARVRVIYNGIDVAAFARPGVDRAEARRRLGLPAEGWIWGTAGRLSPVKGHDVLLRAWAEGGLGARGASLALAGAGPLRDGLEVLAADLGIRGQVAFLGELRDMPLFYAALDGFVFPSRHEGFGLALVEALAAGLPAVASAVGGIPEVLGPLPAAGAAALVPPDDPGALAAALARFMEADAARRGTAAAAARARAGVFDAARMLASLADLYRELVP